VSSFRYHFAGFIHIFAEGNGNTYWSKFVFKFKVIFISVMLESYSAKYSATADEVAAVIKSFKVIPSFLEVALMYYIS